MKEKKTMQKPELEFVRFDATDVIATSGDPMKAKGKEGTEDYKKVVALNGGGIGEVLPQ